MMSEKLQDKMLGAGIIPTGAVREMEHWGIVKKGASKRVGEFDPAKVKALKEEIELQALPTLRETVLDVDKFMDKGREVMLGHEEINGVMRVKAGIDIMKRYIFPIPRDPEEYKRIAIFMHPLAIIHDEHLEQPRDVRQITEISVLYSTVDQGKSVPTHWFCVTTAKGEETILRGR
jgi:hypothetical protein